MFRFTRDKYIHVIVELMPQRYLHTMNCHSNVVMDKHHVFRTMLTRQEINEFKKFYTNKYGADLIVSERLRWGHRSIKLAYSLDRFKKHDNTLRELKKNVNDDLLHFCMVSHLAPALLPAVSRQANYDAL